MNEPLAPEEQVALLEAEDRRRLDLYFGLDWDALTDADRALKLNEAAEIREKEFKEFGEKAVLIADEITLPGALAITNKVLRPVDPRDGFAVIAGAAEAHLVDLLTSVFYVGFSGSTGSGKGTGVEAGIALTPNGEVLGATTEAYLATVLDDGKAVGIEEADRLIKRNPAIASLLRNGYRRGTYYGFKVPVEGKKWEPARRSLFGPKFFDFHTLLEPHLRGRTLVVRMKPENDVDLAMDAEHKERRLAPVRLWLAREALKALASWSDPEDGPHQPRGSKRVTELWDDPSFRARVRRLGGKTGRDHVIGANLLLVCEVLGWDYEEEIRRLVTTRKTFDEFSEEAEVAEAILIWHNEIGGEELPTDDLLFRINTQRESLRVPKRLTPHALGAILGDLGFDKSSSPTPTWVRSKSGPNRDKWILRPHTLFGKLAQMAQVAQIDSQTGPQNGPDGPDGPLSLYEGDEDVDPRTFQQLPPEVVRAERCRRCGGLKDLLFEDPNRKRFCWDCHEAMTGGRDVGLVERFKSRMEAASTIAELETVGDELDQVRGLTFDEEDKVRRSLNRRFEELAQASPSGSLDDVIVESGPEILEELKKETARRPRGQISGSRSKEGE